MKFITYDAGHAIGLLISRRAYSIHLPFPVTLKAWRYIWRNRGKK